MQSWLFFATDVGCPAISWDDWIYDDEKGTKTSGNITLLEKEGPDIYLNCLYDNDGKLNITEDTSEKLKISRDNLMQLVLDWEKVCKKMPTEVTITYENGMFTLQTSDDPLTHKKSKYIMPLLVLMSIGVLFAGIIFYVIPIFKSFPQPTGKYPIGTTTITSAPR